MHLRIIIADDHPVVLHGIRVVLQHHSMCVVGEAQDGSTLLRLLDAQPCDVLLTDLYMPGPAPDGLSLLAAVRAFHPRLPVVVLTGEGHPSLLDQLRRSGVRGLLDKGADFDELPQAVRAVAQGQVHVSRQLRDTLRARDLLQPGAPVGLSGREREVLDLLRAGLSVNQIATRCGRSPKTVSRQKAEAMRKLGMGSNQELHDYLNSFPT